MSLCQVAVRAWPPAVGWSLVRVPPWPLVATLQVAHCTAGLAALQLQAWRGAGLAALRRA